jgi:hypothetical protein
MRNVKMFLVNVLLSVDQFVNVLMLGDPDETISSRAGRVFPDTWWSNLIDHIMFWQTDHCHKAVETGEGKRDILFPLK